jgi:hypothetical protein
MPAGTLMYVTPEQSAFTRNLRGRPLGTGAVAGVREPGQSAAGARQPKKAGNRRPPFGGRQPVAPGSPVADRKRAPLLRRRPGGHRGGVRDGARHSCPCRCLRRPSSSYDLPPNFHVLAVTLAIALAAGDRLRPGAGARFGAHRYRPHLEGGRAGAVARLPPLRFAQSVRGGPDGGIADAGAGHLVCGHRLPAQCPPRPRFRNRPSQPGFAGPGARRLFRGGHRGAPYGHCRTNWRASTESARWRRGKRSVRQPVRRPGQHPRFGPVDGARAARRCTPSSASASERVTSPRSAYLCWAAANSTGGTAGGCAAGDGGLFRRSSTRPPRGSCSAPEDPIGRPIREGESNYTVVGLTRDVPPGFLTAKTVATMFVPLTAAAFRGNPEQRATILVRGTAGRDTLAAVRRQLASLHPDLTVFNVHTMREDLEPDELVHRVGFGDLRDPRAVRAAAGLDRPGRSDGLRGGRGGARRSASAWRSAPAAARCRGW